MLRRSLGNTGLEVSEIAFGGVEIGLPYGIGIKDQEDMLSHKQAVRLLHTALDEGINFFDTARLYGESESIMGKAFHDRRDKIVLATKCKHFRDGAAQIPGYTALKEVINTSLQESLAALKTDYLDVFMLHQADAAVLENDDVRGIFAGLKQSGIIRATGASTYSPEETTLAVQSKAWDVIQLPFNVMDQRQQQVFSLAKENGVGLVIRSVLMKGLLTTKGSGLHPALKKVEDHIKNYTSLMHINASDLPSFAIKFALSFQEVDSVLIGMDSLEYLRQSLQTADGDYFDQATIERIKELAYPEPDFLDLPKWDRMGWLK